MTCERKIARIEQCSNRESLVDGREREGLFRDQGQICCEAAVPITHITVFLAKFRLDRFGLLQFRPCWTKNRRRNFKPIFELSRYIPIRAILGVAARVDRRCISCHVKS